MYLCRYCNASNQIGARGAISFLSRGHPYYTVIPAKRAPRVLTPSLRAPRFLGLVPEHRAEDSLIRGC
jgi:hypothetical protein